MEPSASAGMGIGFTVMICLIVGVVTVLSLAIPGFILFKLYKNKQAADKIRATGVAAQAQVLALADTGVKINYNPRVTLTLMVHPPGGTPYQATTTLTISMLAIPRFQPGAWIPVKYDPASPMNVAVEV